MIEIKWNLQVKKAAANRPNSGVQNPGQSNFSGSSIFAEAYTPSNLYSQHHHKNGKLPSARQAHKNTSPTDAQGKSLKLDQDGYFIFNIR